ncbi:MAG TPA: fumarylacetoacetate hydrolase family protein [Thermodesulfobacteriota bacterium]|nr:fumarylacetoacetate hydrolase family protein [Thermodesulfobacteriota bacterium]
MRLLTFARDSDRAPRVGVLTEEGRVLDIEQEARRAGRPLPFDPADMVSLIEAGQPALDTVRELAMAARGTGTPLERVRVLAPIPRPRKNVFCIGWNYLEHFAEGQGFRPAGQELPEHPVFFTKPPTSVIGPYDPIPFDPAVSEKIDWEVELAVVIGPGGKNIPEARAYEHVFGYTVLNDVSARDLQRRHGGQWFKGKSLDGACPIGPWIVTADELDPNNLRVMTRVNGVVKQDSNTRHFYFKIPRIIAELSLGMTLEPGDIISTGTPQGVGFARTPPEFLKPGDLLETEIEGIGVLRNRVERVGG